MKHIFKITGLDCAQCAAELERAVNQSNAFDKTHIDFIRQKATVYSDNGEKQLLSQLNALASRIEPGVKFIRYDEDESNHVPESFLADKRVLIVVGSLLFGAAFLFPNWSIPLFLLSYFTVGSEVIVRAGKNILKGNAFDEHFLMTLATGGALLIREYPEAVAVMLFYQIGEVVQNYAIERSKKSIVDLMDIRPDFANLKQGDVYQSVHPKDVRVNDIIMVKPGERIPLDGVVIKGESEIDLFSLTGESMYKAVFKDTEIYSGCINISGLLEIRVTKEFEDSTVNRILDLVENATANKAQTERFITRFARVYTPVVVVIAVLMALVLPLLRHQMLSYAGIYRALIFLMVSCPCALVISVPLSFFGGIGAASRKGIIVKGSNYLEEMVHASAIVFDKTGTLTRGEYGIVALMPQGIEARQLLEYAAYGEHFASHPVGLSIVKAFNEKIDVARIKNMNEIFNRGIAIDFDDRSILVGNEQLMRDNGIEFEPVNTSATAVYVAVDSVFVGSILVADQLKENAAGALRQIRALNQAKTAMLTGDNQAIADEIGQQLKIDEIYFELLPQDKVEIFKKIKREHSADKTIVFVGDGINDAPVLALADVGIAMGAMGSDAAIEAADIVLMDDDLAKIAELIRIAKKTRKVVIQNVVFALSVKLLVLILGALGLVTLWSAVFADVAVSVLAILNATRLLLHR